MAAIRRNEKTGLTPDELREQIMLEIEIKSKACSNPTYACSLPRIDGYEYCLRHILRDPSGHYKQCAFTYYNGRKCINALPKHDNKKDPTLTAYCFEHSRKAQLAKTRAAVGKLRIVDSNEVLLNTLAHHVDLKEKAATIQRKALVRCSGDEEIDVVSPQEDAFTNYKHIHDIDKSLVRTRKRRRILDYASDSSNDYMEPPCLRNTAYGLEFEDSDDGSADSADEDLLKHAEIFSRQEIVRVSESKLTKLQRLYIDQITQLRHLLKDRRRKYLYSLRKEREILCSIHDQSKETRRERIHYKQLKAFNTYHQRHGVEAVLYKKFKEKRAKSSDGYKIPSFTKCVFTEGGVKCSARALPCVKYCRKHILEDKKQTLFRACSVDKAGVVCQEAIPCIFDESTCVLHMPFPSKRLYVQKKYESETEEDETSIGSIGAFIKREYDDNDTTIQKDIKNIPSNLQEATTIKSEIITSPNGNRTNK